MGAVVGASLSPRPSAGKLGGQDVGRLLHGEQGRQAACTPLASSSVMSRLEKRQSLGGRKRKNSDKPAAFAWACEEQGASGPGINCAVDHWLRLPPAGNRVPLRLPVPSRG